MQIQDKDRDKVHSEFRARNDGFNIRAELPLDCATFSIVGAAMLILREANDCGIPFKAYALMQGYERRPVDPYTDLYVLTGALHDAFTLVVNTDNQGVAGAIHLLAAFASEPGEDRAYRLGLSAAAIGKAFESEADTSAADS